MLTEMTKARRLLFLKLRRYEKPVLMCVSSKQEDVPEGKTGEERKVVIFVCQNLCPLTDYVKRLHQKACRTCNTSLFSHLTIPNDVILLCCRRFCLRRFFEPRTETELVNISQARTLISPRFPN